MSLKFILGLQNNNTSTQHTTYELNAENNMNITPHSQATRSETFNTNSLCDPSKALQPSISVITCDSIAPESRKIEDTDTSNKQTESDVSSTTIEARIAESEYPLPAEVHHLVLSFIMPEDLADCATTCRSWYHHSRSALISVLNKIGDLDDLALIAAQSIKLQNKLQHSQSFRHLLLSIIGHSTRDETLKEAARVAKSLLNAAGVNLSPKNIQCDSETPQLTCYHQTPNGNTSTNNRYKCEQMLEKDTRANIKIVDCTDNNIVGHVSIDDSTLVHTLTVDDEGKLLAALSSDNILKIWSVQNNKCIFSVPLNNRANLLFGPAGTMLLACLSRSSQTYVWKFNNALEHEIFAMTPCTNLSAKFSSDGKLLVRARDNEIDILDLEGGICLATHTFPSQEPSTTRQTPIKNQIFISGDDRFLAICSQDGKVQIRELKSGIITHEFSDYNHHAERFSGGFTNDGRYFSLWNANRALQVLDLKTGETIIAEKMPQVTKPNH